MIYREVAPEGAAREFVKCFWILEDDQPSSDIQRILPDGRCELILNFGDPFESQQGAEWKRQPRWFLTGQITGPFLVRARGRSQILGIRFQPHGARNIFGLPMQELTGRVVSLDQLSSCVAQQLEKLDDVDTASQRLSALSDVVGTLAEKSSGCDERMAAAIRMLGHAHAASVSEVADLLGLSTRQFERRFTDTVGIPPKLFYRMQRFQRVLRAMDSPDSKWVDVAADCGYYDQPHLIRDFHEFAGEPPSSLENQEIDLARKFARE